MSSTMLCRLCITSCQKFKCLMDDNDQINSVYEIASKYFDTKFLKPGKEYAQSVICIECWRRINEFHKFQQHVIATQNKLETSLPIISVIKLEDQLNISKTTPPEISTFGSSHRLNNKQNCDVTNSSPLPRVKNTNTFQMITNKTVGEHFHEDDLLMDRSDDFGISHADKKHAMDALIFDLIGNVQCTICFQAFKYYALLKEHFVAKHRYEECNVVCCKRKYNQRFKLVRHIRRMHNGKDTYPYSCDVCNRPFLEACKLKIHHQQVHNLIYNYDHKCETCGDSFQHEAGLKRHVNRRHKKTLNIFQWFCYECNSLFNNFMNLEIHTKMEHSHINLTNTIRARSLPLLFCKLCNKMYKAINYFLDHMKEVHSNVVINSDLYSELRSVQAKVKNTQDVYIMDEIMPEEEENINSHNHNFKQLNKMYMPSDLVEVNWEITTISSDSE